MKTRDFFFDLPAELIAQEPAKERGNSRLLVVDRKTGSFSHLDMHSLPGLMEPGTCVVFNDSRVRKARLYAVNEATGAKVEFLFLEQLTPQNWAVLTSKQRRQKPGRVYLFPGNVHGRIAGSRDDQLIVEMDAELTESYFEEHGHVPLPPYIKRGDAEADAERYQTVYSRLPGSAAAPTAGLHFTDALLEELQARGCKLLYVTLHVGLGTFLPIRAETVEEHRMHEEHYHITDQTADALNQALAAKRPILAVGTTVVRTLESACSDGRIKAGHGKTSIYIYPGYPFKVASRLFTNFHTPESTLLLLVSAFAGQELIRAAYQEAISKQYRFFSYGDAMLLL